MNRKMWLALCHLRCVRQKLQWPLPQALFIVLAFPGNPQWQEGL